MLNWLVRTSFKIQLLPSIVLLPFEALCVSFAAALVTKFWYRPTISSTLLWWWFAGIILYGLVLFALAWKKEGVDGDESRFALALVAFFMLPIFLVVFVVAWIVNMVEERK